jgi:hypothetical protein
MAMMMATETHKRRSAYALGLVGWIGRFLNNDSQCSVPQTVLTFVDCECIYRIVQHNVFRPDDDALNYLMYLAHRIVAIIIKNSHHHCVTVSIWVRSAPDSNATTTTTKPQRDGNTVKVMMN